METDNYLSVPEAAKELSITVSSVHTALAEKRLPFVTLYGRKLILRADLEAYKRRTRPGGEKPRGRPRKPLAERAFEYRGRSVVITKTVVTGTTASGARGRSSVDRCTVDGHEIAARSGIVATLDEWEKAAREYIDGQADAQTEADAQMEEGTGA